MTTPTPNQTEKSAAAAAYVPLLFWVPFVVAPQSGYAKRHGVSGAVLFFGYVFLKALLSFLSLGIFGYLLWLIYFAVCLMSGYLAYMNDASKPIPGLTEATDWVVETFDLKNKLKL